MSLARTVLFIALALCAATLPSYADDPDTDSSKRYQAPAEPPILLAWKPGQWATYELKGPKGTWEVRVIVIAEDVCGMWLDIEVDEGSGHRTDTRLCVARSPGRNPIEPPDRIQFEVFGRDRNFTKAIEADEPLDGRKLADATGIFDQSWSGQRGLKREDVTTPAGTFVAALAQTPGSLSRWSHPAVPITGVVKQIDGAYELTITSFGTSYNASAMRDDARTLVSASQNMNVLMKPRKMWLMYALGSNFFGTIDATEATTSLGFSLGFRLNRSLALIFGSTNLESVPFAQNADLREDLVFVHGSLRWYVYADATGRWSLLQRGIYIQGDAGFAQMRRGDSEMSSVVGRGIIGGARLGIATGVATDWKLALELTGHTALLNGDEGTRINLGLIAVIELYMPTPW